MRNVVIFMLSLLAMQATAQTKVKVIIGGKELSAAIYDTGEIELCDDNKHKIDDHEKPFFIHSRTLPALKKSGSTTLNIPEQILVNSKMYTLTKIGSRVFADYQNLRNVVIPSTVREIGDYAFFRTPLTTVRIPERCTLVGDRAFGECHSLKRVDMPASLKAIGRDVFAESDVAVERYTPDGNSVELAIVDDNVLSDVDENIPQTSVRNEHKYALIIANKNYKNASPVRFAHKDGKSVYDYCTQTLGIPTRNVKLMNDATQGEIKQRLEWVSKLCRSDKDAEVILYYSGHGVPDAATEMAYLLPIDSYSNTAESGISLRELYKKLGSMQASKTLVMLDACFSGAQFDNKGAEIYTKEETPEGNMVVLSAATGKQTAHEYNDKGHGMFTYFLLKKLQQSEGNVSLGDLADYLQSEVSRESLLTNDQEQTPTAVPSTAANGTWRNWKLK